MGRLGEIGWRLFGPGGAGAVVLDLMLLGLFEPLASYLVAAVGSGNISRLIKSCTQLVGIGLLVKTSIDTLLAICKAFGIL
jgi:hypothetical protein